MTSVITLTPPATSAEAAHMLAEVLEEMDRIAQGADNAQLFERLVADGADAKDDAGVVLNWIELRFGHLFGMVSILPDAIHTSRYSLRISGISCDLPTLFCEIHEGWWS